MKAICRVLPHEDILYFGDTANLPYGTKSKNAIIRYSLSSASYLVDQGIKLLIVACHTASSHALEELQNKFSIPVVGVVNSGVEEVVKKSNSKHIAILGTKATIRSGYYQREILERCPAASVTAIACPLFVPLIEEGYIDHPITDAVIKETLGLLHAKQVDSILLGCTHYPLLEKAIQKEMGPSVSIIDPAISCAHHVKDLLQSKGLCKQKKDAPSYRFYVSDDPDKFQILGHSFLGSAIDHVTAIAHSTHF